jgi:hypothetical protein
MKAFRFPRHELVVELAACRHAPQQQRRRRQFRMVRARGERRQRVDQRLAAALGHVDVVLDEHLIVRLVGELATDERELVASRKRLPELVVGLRPAVAVRSRNENHDRA